MGTWGRTVLLDGCGGRRFKVENLGQGLNNRHKLRRAREPEFRGLPWLPPWTHRFSGCISLGVHGWAQPGIHRGGRLRRPWGRLGGDRRGGRRSPVQLVLRSEELVIQCRAITQGGDTQVEGRGSLPCTISSVPLWPLLMAKHLIVKPKPGGFRPRRTDRAGAWSRTFRVLRTGGMCRSWFQSRRSGGKVTTGFLTTTNLGGGSLRSRTDAVLGHRRQSNKKNQKKR